MPRRPPCVLSIAGSDSGGGAGIQADLKAFAACGVHGMTAITAVTAQNTTGVSVIHTIPAEVIIAQVQAVVQDIGVDAVKIGMVGSAVSVRAVVEALNTLPRSVPVVIDPVMVSESGAQLLEPSARRALTSELLPLATVLTPNLPEARVLVGDEAGGGSEEEATYLARAIKELGPACVVVTGGHRQEAADVFYDGEQVVSLLGRRYPSGAAHGSGCTHSSVLAARLAWGDPPLEAARVARQRAGEAVRDGLSEVGSGPGPVNILGMT
jgi:hydroxymethylpyrimidine/phosphomethylpyrimidine kinase